MVIVFSKHKGREAKDKVAAALELIRDFDPVRHNRMVRDLKRIWITTITGAAGQFVNSTSTCELDERFVLGEHTTTEQVAGAIVHEATHARLHQSGIGCEQELRDRVEQVCMGRELAFAAKLPDGESIYRWVEARQDHSVDYSNAAFNAREIAGARDALLHLNAPGWLADTIVFFARRRHQKHLKRQETERRLNTRT
ncbi:MAG: hypothetical protein ABJB10_21915 [Mesorhizobium sp.]